MLISLHQLWLQQKILKRRGTFPTHESGPVNISKLSSKYKQANKQIYSANILCIIICRSVIVTHPLFSVIKLIELVKEPAHTQRRNGTDSTALKSKGTSKVAAGNHVATLKLCRWIKNLLTFQMFFLILRDWVKDEFGDYVPETLQILLVNRQAMGQKATRIESSICF